MIFSVSLIFSLSDPKGTMDTCWDKRIRGGGGDEKNIVRRRRRSTNPEIVNQRQKVWGSLKNYESKSVVDTQTKHSHIYFETWNESYYRSWKDKIRRDNEFWKRFFIELHRAEVPWNERAWIRRNLEDRIFRRNAERRIYEENQRRLQESQKLDGKEVVWTVREENEVTSDRSRENCFPTSPITPIASAGLSTSWHGHLITHETPLAIAMEFDHRRDVCVLCGLGDTDAYILSVVNTISLFVVSNNKPSFLCSGENGMSWEYAAGPGHPNTPSSHDWPRSTLLRTTMFDLDVVEFALLMYNAPLPPFTIEPWHLGSIIPGYVISPGTPSFDHMIWARCCWPVRQFMMIRPSTLSTRKAMLHSLTPDTGVDAVYVFP